MSRITELILILVLANNAFAGMTCDRTTRFGQKMKVMVDDVRATSFDI